MLKAPRSVQELERVRRFDARAHPLRPEERPLLEADHARAQALLLLLASASALKVSGRRAFFKTAATAAAAAPAAALELRYVGE